MLNTVSNKDLKPAGTDSLHLRILPELPEGISNLLIVIFFNNAWNKEISADL